MAARSQIIVRHVLASSATAAAPTGAGEGLPTGNDLDAVVRDCKGYERLLERNWHGSIRFNGTPSLPTNLKELQQLVKEASAPLRVVGRGHSFTPLSECAGGTLVSLAKMNRVLDFQPPTEQCLGSVTIEGGTTYTEVAAFLGKRGALKNLPSCPQFSVAGAIATGTHGSGVHIQNLATHVAAIEFVKADGTLVRYSRSETPDLLEGCRVHLGCLGVVSQLTLDVVPFYEVETFMYYSTKLEQVLEALPRLWGLCDSLSIYTNCLCEGPEKGTAQVMFRHFAPHWEPRLQAPGHVKPEAVKDSVLLLDELLPRAYADAERPEPLLWQPTGRRPWIDALTLTCDGGKETEMVATDLQSELFVPLSQTAEALKAVLEVSKKWTSGPDGILWRFEFREVKGDGGWMSPHPVDSLGIHVSFAGGQALVPEVQRAVAQLEDGLWPLRPRAHWGKLGPRCFAPGRLGDLYGKGLQRFRALCREHDPHGKFLNAHARQMLAVLA